MSIIFVHCLSVHNLEAEVVLLLLALSIFLVLLYNIRILLDLVFLVSLIEAGYFEYGFQGIRRKQRGRIIRPRLHRLAMDILGATSWAIAPAAISLSLLFPKVLECAILSIGLLTPFVKVFDELPRGNEGHPTIPGAQSCIFHLETACILMF